MPLGAPSDADVLSHVESAPWVRVAPSGAGTGSTLVAAGVTFAYPCAVLNVSSRETTRVKHRSYERPLITEIYSEVHFSVGAFTPTLFFDVVPALKSLGFESVHFGRSEVLGVAGDERDIQQPNAPHVRCWSSDKRRLVQLFEDMIAVNLVAPYPGWATYRDLFAGVRDVVIAEVGRLPVESLSLNTIDRLVAEREGFTLGKYLNCGGPRIPAACSEIQHAFDFTLGTGLLHDDGFNRQTRLSGRPVGGTFEIFISAVFHEAFSRGNDLVELLDKLHEESVDAFEGMITDVTRDEVMGGIKRVART